MYFSYMGNHPMLLLEHDNMYYTVNQDVSWWHHRSLNCYMSFVREQDAMTAIASKSLGSSDFLSSVTTFRSRNCCLPFGSQRVEQRKPASAGHETTPLGFPWKGSPGRVPLEGFGTSGSPWVSRQAVPVQVRIRPNSQLCRHVFDHLWGNLAPQPNLTGVWIRLAAL